MQNYKGDNYQKLRSLYQEKFIKDGWQPFHKPFTTPIKLKFNNLSLTQITSKDQSSPRKTLLNTFGSFQQNRSYKKKQSYLKNKGKIPKSEIFMVCQYSQQTPTSQWLKESEKTYRTARGSPFTSQSKERKWIYDDIWLDYKRKEGQTAQQRQRDEERHLSKKATMYILAQLDPKCSKNSKYRRKEIKFKGFKDLFKNSHRRTSKAKAKRLITDNKNYPFFFEKKTSSLLFRRARATEKAKIRRSSSYNQRQMDGMSSSTNTEQIRHPFDLEHIEQ